MCVQLRLMLAEAKGQGEEKTNRILVCRGGAVIELLQWYVSGTQADMGTYVLPVTDGRPMYADKVSVPELLPS